MKKNKSSKDWINKKNKENFFKKSKIIGYRSRSAFKLLEMEKKFNFFKKNSYVLDLGCCPGGWLQVVTKKVKVGKVLGVDIKNMEEIKNVNFIKGDFLERDTKDKIENDIYYAREIDRNKSLLKPLLNFHNYHVKNLFMYDRFKGKKSLFDIACGQGGDLFKWIKADYKTVIASDINKDNLMNVRSGIYKRYNSVIRNNKNNKQKMLFLQLDASKKWNRDYIESLNDKMFRNLASIFFGFTNKSQISDSILVKYHKRINKQFDLVSCMFAIHYMFDNIDSLRNVIHNIDMILKNGGYFFGVCLDGYLVNQKFKSSKKDVIEAKVGNRLLWSIKKKYNKFNDFNQDKPLDNIGQKISVYIETINQELDEYLVDYELLKYELAKRKIFPVESNELKDIKLESVGSSTGSFEEIYKLYNKKNSIKLDKNNQEYSFLNRWFIFKKK